MMEHCTLRGGEIDPEHQYAPVASIVSLLEASVNHTGFQNAGGKLRVRETASPAPSCMSEKSIDVPILFKCGGQSSGLRTKAQAAGSPKPDHTSVKSHLSMLEPFSFGNDPATSASKEKEKIASNQELDNIFQEVLQMFISLVTKELKTFQKLLSVDNPACSERDVEDKDNQKQRGVLKITLNILRNMKQTNLANTLESKFAPPCQKELKSKLRDKCQRINEGISGHQNVALLNEIFTELYITEGGSGEVNQEHEVKQIEAASRNRATQSTPIKCNDIFRPLQGKDQTIKTVMTTGVAGIGKTVSVQKFILDWAEKGVNQDITFIFPLPFRELNLMKEKKLSLVKLLQHFFPETQELKPKRFKRYKIMFIFDGLDECRLPLDFNKNENLVDIEEETSVDVLLTNLIKGKLLPSALLWITSRPAAACQIPPELVDQVTEVRGFSDPQKQDYFRRRFTDQDLANRVLTHIKSSRSLYIMCHIPVFCWIAATVLERMLSEAESEETPKTLTQMFTYFLIYQIKHKNQRSSGKGDPDPQETRKSILALGKLAFQQLEKGKLIFYEEDLKESGINIKEVSEYCTQIFREEHELHLGRVFSFVHLSIQEFLAALYAFFNKKVPSQEVTEQPTRKLSKIFSKTTMADFLKSAVDRALQSKSGRLDLFLRFFLGLSLECNLTLLRGILTPTEKISYNNEETVRYIKEKIKENTSPEKSINLFHCLNELNDHSLVQEVQRYIKRGGGHRLRHARLSPAQWSALVFVLQNSEQELDEFDLSKYEPSEECFLMLLSVVKASRKAVLASCHLGVKTCEELASIFNLENSSLKELDISNNDLQDLGVEQLSAGLKSSHCKLQILRLSLCNIGAKTCEILGSILNLKNSSLKELDLSNNNLQDSGVEMICAGLMSSHCTLQTLRLAMCNIGEKTCENLGSVLNLENNSVTELDLSNNDLHVSGVKLIAAGLKSSHCKLQILRLSGCMVTEEGCSSLDSALNSNPSYLKELDLNYNHPGKSGVKLFLDRLLNPQSKLEKLSIKHGGKTRIKPGLKKYRCNLTLDPNTAHTYLSLSQGNRRVECGEFQLYPDHPERFDVYQQVISRENLTGRCYWEAEWSGKRVTVAVTYKTISRKGEKSDCGFGGSVNSWSLICCDNGYSVQHNKTNTELPHSSSCCRRVGVYVDCLAGTISFYNVSSDTETLTHLHTFYTKFTQSLYAGIYVNNGASVSLCDIE